MTTKDTTLRLGQVMRDKVSRYEGIAVAKEWYMPGTIQFVLNAKYNPSASYQDQGQQFDIGQLEAVTERKADWLPEPFIMQDTGILLGCEVQEIVSKLKGMATSRCDFLNGCTYYHIEAKANAAGERKQYFFDYKRLQYKGKGVSELIKKRMEEAAAQYQQELAAASIYSQTTKEASKSKAGKEGPGGPTVYKPSTVSR